MYYENLSPAIQNIIMLNFEFIGKFLILFIALSYSFWYLLITHKNQEPTGYMLKGLVRIMLYFLTKTFIVISPLFIFFLYPQASLDHILNFLIIFYIIAFFVFSIIFMVNAFYLAPLMVLKIGGYEPELKKQMGRKRYNFFMNAAFQKYNKKFDEYIKKLKNGND